MNKDKCYKVTLKCPSDVSKRKEKKLYDIADTLSKHLSTGAKINRFYATYDQGFFKSNILVIQPERLDERIIRIGYINNKTERTGFNATDLSITLGLVSFKYGNQPVLIKYSRKL